MAYPYQPWRAAYQPASFGGAGFKVEVDSQAGGRRNAVHEFPHQDTPWAEDMGRKARRWTIAAYVIGPNYTTARDALIAACEREGPLTLVHPLLGSVQANCDDYVSTERRELGGYAIIELRFVEAGQQPGTVVTADTQSQVGSAAANSDATAANSANGALGGSAGIGSDTVASQEATAAAAGQSNLGQGGIGADVNAGSGTPASVTAGAGVGWSGSA